MRNIPRLFPRTIPIIVLFLLTILFTYQTRRAVDAINNEVLFNENKKTILIDAGHGGEDGGTVGVNGVYEKNINFAIAEELNRQLKQQNFQTIMMREGDALIGDNSLGTIAERKRSDTKIRLDLIRQNGDCIYVSIHQNYFQEAKYKGAQIFYSDKNEESAILAEAIRSSIVSETQPENTRQNKIADQNIYILFHCEVPAVLVECGFLSNPEEAEKLVSTAYQKQIATAIYDGICDYIYEVE